ncbi:MAG: DUF4129 domain-containing protein [Bacteroidota bacterium]
MPRIFFIIFFSSVLIAGTNISAQNTQENYLQGSVEQRSFPDEKYSELTKGVDFTEEEYERKKEKEEAPPANFEGLGAVLKFIVILLGIALLIFLLIKALTNDNLFSRSDKKLKPATVIDLKKIEENLEDTELEDPIKQAIEAGDYPLAVRLYYLAVLKDLSMNNKIKWKKDKTNGEYLRELTGTPIFDKFQKITLVFERIWYGKMELTQVDFHKVEKLFLKILPTKVNI